MNIPLVGTTMMKSVLDLVFSSCDLEPANIAVLGVGWILWHITGHLLFLTRQQGL